LPLVRGCFLDGRIVLGSCIFIGYPLGGGLTAVSGGAVPRYQQHIPPFLIIWLFSFTRNTTPGTNHRRIKNIKLLFPGDQQSARRAEAGLRRKSTGLAFVFRGRWRTRRRATGTSFQSSFLLSYNFFSFRSRCGASVGGC